MKHSPWLKFKLICQGKSKWLLRLSQKTYIYKALERYNMHDCSMGVVSMFEGENYNFDQCPWNKVERSEKVENNPHAPAMGKLNVAQTYASFDISFFVKSIRKIWKQFRIRSLSCYQKGITLSVRNKRLHAHV